MITDTQALADFCARLRSADYITVDTEFMRETTYWPILCLVQVAYGEHVAVVDTLHDELSLRPLKALLLNQSIVKVFHAARQDLEIFLAARGGWPAQAARTSWNSCLRHESVFYALA